MSEQDIQKNFELSAQFNSDAVKNPEMLKGIPASACIVMGSQEHSEFTRKNKKLAKKIMKEERKKCYQASRVNGKWTIEPVVA